VVGGGSGIGAACAHRFGQDGYRVLVADLDAAAAAKVAGRCPQGRGVHVDVTQADSVDRMMTVVADWGGLLAVAETSQRSLLREYFSENTDRRFRCPP
jgi:NAD(P)-dependent dehydrogenase (short-subunit alcohol dehydrogenase family)